MNRRSPVPQGALVRVLVPLAFFASAASLSAHHSDPQNSAETAFLGLVATVVLCGLGAVDRRPHFIQTAAALLAMLALWALPAGDARGAAVSLVLTAGVALAAHHRLLAERTEIVSGTAVGLALSAQALFRPEIWLAPGRLPAIAVEAILLPVVVGLASARLTRSRGLPFLLGIAAAVSIQRGVNPELALALVVFAAADAARGRRRAAMLWTAVGAAVLFTYHSELALLLGAGGDWPDLTAGLSRLLILVPAILLPARGSIRVVLAALVLAIAGLWLLPMDAALLVPLLVIFGCLPRDLVGLRLQATWSLALTIGAALTSGYPWLRTRPVDSVLAMLGLEVGWRSALIVAAVFWSLVAILRELQRRAAVSRRETRWSVHPAMAAVAAIGAIGCGLLITVLPSFRGLLVEPVVLSESQPVQEIEAIGSMNELFVDSYVSNGVSVAPGTPLAAISIEGQGGTLHELVLRAGIDTGEWAAQRPGVSVVAPQPWISWLAPDGPYFAQRYRAHRRFEAPVEATLLRLQRLDDLPAELELAVFQVGVRP